MSRQRAFTTIFAGALVGYVYWFFGNLYEAVVRVPDIQAAKGSTTPDRAIFAPGSPARYYIPVGPPTVLATLLALLLGWPLRLTRRGRLAAMVLLHLLAVLLSTYMIKRINLPLFYLTASVDTPTRTILLRRWYRLNYVRLALVAGAIWAGARMLLPFLGIQRPDTDDAIPRA